MQTRTAMNYIHKLLLSIILLMLPGCGALNNATVEGFLGSNNNLIDLAYVIAEDLERRAYPPLSPRDPDLPILATTFANNHNLEQTSQFSRILQEHITSRFVQMGYTAREIKLQKQLHIQPRVGEKMLSRQLDEIKTTQTAQAIAVGTYSLTRNDVYISARLINPENGNIISAADYQIPINQEILAMFGSHIRANRPIDPVEEPKASFMTRLLY